MNWRSEIQLDQRCERGESRESYRGRVGQQTLSTTMHVVGAIVVSPLDNPTKGFERASRGSPG